MNDTVGNALAQSSLPANDGSLRFLLLNFPKTTRHRCSACGFLIRDRRPGPFKRNQAVCVDRIGTDRTRDNWAAVLCKGCGVMHYQWPVKTLDEIYWPSHWDDTTNA